MITRVFSKSNPANFLIVVATIFVAFIIHEVRLVFLNGDTFSFFFSFLKISCLILSLFLVNFISKRNILTKDNTYSFLYLGIFILFIPESLANVSALIANFFVLLSIRKILSFKTLNSVKEKIFDASLWIFVASIFEFWCILYMILVFVVILLYNASDFRNWFLPVIAFFTVLSIFYTICLFTNLSFDNYLNQKVKFDVSINFFNSKTESAEFVLFLLISIIFLILYLIGLKKKPTSIQSVMYKILFLWIIGLTIVFISPEKSNALLLFSFLPVSIFAVNFLESETSFWFKESITWILVLTAFGFFIFY